MAPSHRYPIDPQTSRVTLRGNTVVNGANTFATGTGTVSLNGATTVADSPLNGKHGEKGDFTTEKNAEIDETGDFSREIPWKIMDQWSFYDVLLGTCRRNYGFTANNGETNGGFSEEQWRKNWENGTSTTANME